MKHALLLIKPQYARLILNSKKTVEIRRQQPWLDPGTTLFLYATSPKRAVVGAATVQYVLWNSTEWVWMHCRNMICMNKKTYSAYIGDRPKVAAIFLENPIRLTKLITLAQIRAFSPGWHPKGSYQHLYADNPVVSLFEKQMPPSR